MPATARRHFDEDIARARAILQHATECTLPMTCNGHLPDDLLRSSWMFAVGAMDAYFCDAYVSLLARTIRGKNLQPSGVELPKFVNNTKVSVSSILGAVGARPNWRWRMAIRDLMERDNVLSLGKVRKLFNPFLADDSKFFTGVVEGWISRRGANARIFGLTSATFQSIASGRARNDAKKDARESMEKRFGTITQRRHDCIHNCDRPKVSLQTIHSAGTVRNVIRDIEFLIVNCDDHLDRQFPQFLERIGCNAVTRNALGQ